MCMYSLYVGRGQTVTAKVGMNLTKTEYRNHAVFMDDTGTLACIRHGTELMIDNMQFAPGTATRIIAKYTGARMSVSFMDANHVSWRRRGYAADSIVLPDSTVIPFILLADGVTAHRERAVRKDKGTKRPRNLSKLMGLDQIRAEVDPNPKPEGEEQAPAPAQPEPTPEPAREPEQAIA